MTVSQSPQTTAAQEGGRTLFVDIIQQVAALRDLDPLEMPRMADQIDLDALDRVFVQDDSPGEPRGTLSFNYAGCHVQVHSDGSVDVQQAADSAGALD